MEKKLVCLSLIIALLAFLLAGCGGQEQKAGEPIKFKIGHATWVGYGPLYIAKEKGYFQENGIDPELTVVEDESQYAAAVTSGELDGLGNVLDREIIHYSKGAPIQCILAMDESYGGDGVIAKKEIIKPQDLKGATIGLDKSSTSYFFFLAILNKYGLSEKDVKIQEMAAGDAGAAFVAGKLDAAVTWEPWLTKASQRQGGHVLVTSRDFPGTIVDVITLRQDFVKEHPEAVVGLTKAWFKAIDFWKKNPEEGNKIMAKALGLSEEEIADMVKGVRFLGKEENVKMFADKTGSNPGSIFYLNNLAAKFWKEKGIMDADTDAGKLINTKFVEEASK